MDKLMHKGKGIKILRVLIGGKDYMDILTK